MAAYRRAWKGYYAYLAEGLDYRMKVFHWQARSTVIIFYTVLLLVFAGILFSGIQFYKSLRMPKESGLQADQPLTEFEASTSVRLSYSGDILVEKLYLFKISKKVGYVFFEKICNGPQGITISSWRAIECTRELSEALSAG